MPTAEEKIGTKSNSCSNTDRSVSSVGARNIRLPEWWSSEKQYIIGDCMVGMKKIPDKAVDLVITDPPYGVLDEFWDVIPKGWLDECLRIGKNVIFTPGIRNMFDYPKPRWIFCWAKPGSTRRNDTGGFNHWEPLLYYGDRKMMVDFLYLPDVVNHAYELGYDPKFYHPSIKPIALFEYLVEHLTDNNGDIVFDPFLGSGTTLLACRKTDRVGLGFEINPEYEALIRKRAMMSIASLEDYE